MAKLHTVSELKEFMWKDNQPINYSPEAIPRTQDLEPYYCETCGMYMFSKELMQKEHRRIGHRPYLIPVSKIEALDINEPIDFDICNAVYNMFLKEK